MVRYKLKNSLMKNVSLFALCGIVAVTPLSMASADEGDDKKDITFDEMVVTASKRGAQSLLDSSLAITAFSGAELERTGAATLTDFLNKTPGLNLTPVNPGNNVIQIRGISSTFGDPTVGLYLDNVPFATVVNLEFPEVPTFDVAQVEVLRGPQGTLYGASSQGGTIIVNTNDANTTEFEVKADLSVSFTKNAEESFSADAAINIPIVEDKVGIRFVAGVRDAGGYIDDSSIDAENVNDSVLENYRVKLKITPTEELSIKLGGWFQRLEADGSTAANDDYDRPLGATIAASGLGVMAEFNNTKYDVYNAVIEYDFGDFSLYSGSAYLEFEEQIFDGTFITGSPFDASFDNRTVENFSQEIRLNSTHDGMFQWLIGAFYNDNTTSFLFAPAPGLPGVVDEEVTSESIAIFGEATLSLMDGKLDLTAGLRYFDDDRTDFERDTSLSTGFLGLVGVDQFREANFNTVQPKFNVTFRPTEDMLIYANVARGFRSGIIQPGGVVALNIALGGFFPALDVQEESLWSYEVGTKGSLSDDKFRYDIAFYYNDWSDIQIFGAEPGVGIAFAFNGSSAEAYGIDWALEWLPIDGLVIGTSGNWNNSEYTDVSPFIDVNGVAAIAQVVTGDPIYLVPEFSISATATYNFDIPNLDANGFVFLEVQHNSSRPDPISNGAGEANTFLNGRVGFERENYGLYLFANNITDERGSLFPVNPEAASVGASFTSRARPRTFGVNLKFNM